MAETTTPSVAAPYVALCRALKKTEDVPERLELHGLASRGDDGGLVLRGDVRGPLEDLEARLQTSLDAGATHREAAEASRLDVDHGKATYVIYALFPTDGGKDLYVGESGQTMAKRFAEHPRDCPELAAAMEQTGGKDAWTCAVLLVLPEDARSKELLLYIEARIQRLLDTVDGAHGRNCHYGAGVYSGAPDEERWLAKYVKLIEFVAKNGKTPSCDAKDADEKTVGIWAAHQRAYRDELSMHRYKALGDIGSAWQWRIKASPMSNAVLFAKLRADERVTSSGGMDIPNDIVGAIRLNSARQRFASEKMSEIDRAIVRAEFPGLAMTARNAAFYLNAKAFAAAHPGAETFPSKKKEPTLYNWLSDVQNGAIHTDTTWRREVLVDLGLSALLGMRKSIGVRVATAEKQRARTAERNAEVAASRVVAREAEKRRKIDDVLAGPSACVETL